LKTSNLERQVSIIEKKENEKNKEIVLEKNKENVHHQFKKHLPSIGPSSIGFKRSRLEFPKIDTMPVNRLLGVGYKNSDKRSTLPFQHIN
jgi:hypothetical protein